MDVFGGSGVWAMLSQATLVVRFVLIILSIMSLVSWTLIFYKLIVLYTARKRAQKEIEIFNEADNLTAAIQSLRDNPKSNLYQIGIKGVAEMNRLEGTNLSQSLKVKTGMDTLRRVLRKGINDESSKLAYGLSFLATCGNSAPFIGLFGTVWGIMHAFHSIGQQKTAALAIVAPGISEALVATAVGLAVAIPATIAYNAFLGMLSRAEAEFVNFAGVFLNKVQRELPMVAQETV